MPENAYTLRVPLTATLHYAIDGTWFDYDEGSYEQVPACGNDFRGRKKLTDDWEAVTCKTCRQLLGFDEQLTEVHGDPFLRRAA
jgi:hypothetical protein